MALKLYSYISRRLERFRPVDRERVRMYACGPTAYDYAHLGHARTYVPLDVLSRHLTHSGYRVCYVRSTIDVGHKRDIGEERLLLNARRAEMGPREAAEHYIWRFQDDMDALGLRRPSLSPRATCHIPEIVTWVEDLIDTGYAYEVMGNVYFSTAQFADYGELSQCSLNDRQVNGDPAIAKEKRSPADFVLWQRVESDDLQRWPSPWGQGAPSAHVAGTVSATKYLGGTIDIYGGELADVFPHGDREIAQSVAHNRVPYANYWMAIGALRVNGQEMSIRRGNFLTVRDALKLYASEAIRYFMLNTHYREDIAFSRDGLQTAQRQIARLHRTVQRLRRRIQSTSSSVGAGTASLSDVASLDDYRADFQAALDDDLNTPHAIAVLFELLKEVDLALESEMASLGTLSAMDRLFRDLAGDVLGIVPDSLEVQAGGYVVEGLIEYLLELWREFYEAREWSRADAIRSKLDELGIAIESDAQATTWRFKGGA